VLLAKPRFAKSKPKRTEKELEDLVKKLEMNPVLSPFSNSTGWTLKKVYDEDHALLEKNFRAYVNGFSKNVEEIIDHFNYRATIGLMVKNNRLAPSSTNTPFSILDRPGSQPLRWAMCTKSSCGDFRSKAARKPESTSRQEKSFG